MLRFFFRGDDVPNWLIRFEPKSESSIRPRAVTFLRACCVYNVNKKNHIRPIFGRSSDPAIFINGQVDCSVESGTKGAGLIIHAAPIININIAIVFVIIVAVLCFKYL